MIKRFKRFRSRHRALRALNSSMKEWNNYISVIAEAVRKG